MKKILFLFVVFFSIIFTGCGHKHTYAEATCTEPKTCTECGKTEGEPLGHDFSKATCEQPATCNRCDKTEGTALGHTTEVGLYQSCTEYQGKDIIMSIVNKLRSGNKKFYSAFNTQLNRSGDAYNNFSNGIPYYEEGKTYYEESLDLCRDYDVLADLKEDIHHVLDTIPLNLPGSDTKSMLSYIEEIRAFIDIQYECELTMESLIREINQQ